MIIIELLMEYEKINSDINTIGLWLVIINNSISIYTIVSKR